MALWDLEEGRALWTLHGHAAAVTAVALSADGQRAVSSSREGTLVLWDLAQGKALAGFSGDGPMGLCAASPDGRYIAAGDALGRLHLLCAEEPE